MKEKLAKNGARLYGVTLDYWANKYTSESYLTVTIHFESDAEMHSCVLKTLLFDQPKTGGN